MHRTVKEKKPFKQDQYYGRHCQYSTAYRFLDSAHYSQLPSPHGPGTRCVYGVRHTRNPPVYDSVSLKSSGNASSWDYMRHRTAVKESIQAMLPTPDDVYESPVLTWGSRCLHVEPGHGCPEGDKMVRASPGGDRHLLKILRKKLG